MLVLGGATTAVATQTNVSTAQAAPAAPRGIARLHGQVSLPDGPWTDTPLEVKLPRSGTYQLDADVRGRSGGAPPINSYITARLWDVESATALPESERLIRQVINANAREGVGNQTAPIQELVKVGGPTTIRLQARRIDATGHANIAQIYSDANGYTSLRYERVGS
ncbi:hypothetical protein [Streptomyces sp. C10]|uniref:hypothetical protein n=1 Tax=Streptomyces sp. C10 TaxID=531941 RepID=UPI003980FAFE